MSIKKFFLSSMLTVALVALVVLSVITLVPSKSLAQGVFSHPTGESSAGKAEAEDPHRRFREGFLGERGFDRGMASPHERAAKKGVHPPFSAQGLRESLDLDDAQAEKVRHLLSEYRKSVILKKANLRVAQIDLDEAVANRDFVVSDVKKKAMERESAATDLTMVRVNALVKAREVLSEEQYHKFMAMLSHQMSRHGRKGKHGRYGSRGRSHPGGESHGTRGGSGY